MATPIEDAVNGVEDMIYMSSKSANDGSYSLTVTFEVGSDSDMALVRVQNRVKLAEPIAAVGGDRHRPEHRRARAGHAQDCQLHLLRTNSLDYKFISNYVKINVQSALARVEWHFSAANHGRGGLLHAAVAGPGQDGQRSGSVGD